MRCFFTLTLADNGSVGGLAAWWQPAGLCGGEVWGVAAWWQPAGLDVWGAASRLVLEPGYLRSTVLLKDLTKTLNIAQFLGVMCVWASRCGVKSSSLPVFP